jgi:hypothetical protein
VLTDFLLKMAQMGKDLRDLSPESLAALLQQELESRAAPKLNTESLVVIASLLKRGIRLKVLILGPGKSGGEIYLKRCHLRELLTRLGHEAHFCEDIWTRNALERSGLNLAVAEYVQALAYDYVICLMASPGSIGEAHDFAKDKRIAVKMMICVDRKHKRGYSASGVLRIFEGYNGKLDWFKTPTDIADCHLAKRVVEHIQKVAERKQWELATGGNVS